MSREHWYFLAGMVVILLPLLGYVVVKKSGLFDIRPNRIVTYKETDGHKLALHIFDAKRTQGDNSSPPVLLLFHGGAWQYGGPQAFYEHCRYFARHGLTCISVLYRIGSVHGTDARAAVQDARAALAYLHRHADKLSIDTTRIAAGGGSSGGHLAAALGVPLPLPDDNPNPLPEIRPHALILYNPMIDLAPCSPDHHLVKDYWEAMSPLQHMDSTNPPTLILLGTADPEVPVTTARAYCKAMAAHGADCQLELYEGAKHGFFNPGVENNRYFDATNARVIRFLSDLDFVRE